MKKDIIEVIKQQNQNVETKEKNYYGSYINF